MCVHIHYNILHTFYAVLLFFIMMYGCSVVLVCIPISSHRSIKTRKVQVVTV